MNNLLRQFYSEDECLMVTEYESGKIVMEIVDMDDALDKYSKCETGLTGMVSVTIFRKYIPTQEELPDAYHDMTEEDRNDI